MLYMSDCVYYFAVHLLHTSSYVAYIYSCTICDFLTLQQPWNIYGAVLLSTSKWCYDLCRFK